MAILKVTEPEKLGFSSQRLARIDQRMERYIEEQQLSGTMTLIARKGEVVHCACCGMRDIENQTPLTEDTIFRIYSMTKPITSVAAMMLYEEGLFQLDDPVAKYLPAFADTKVYSGSGFGGMELVDQQREMTIQHLMSHTAGLSYGWFLDTPVEDGYRRAKLMDRNKPLDKFVAEIAKLPLLYQPGTQWRYSLATDVLGHLVEVISGKSLDTFFAEEIFQPLGMVDTGFHVPTKDADRLASMYRPTDPPPRSLIINMLPKGETGKIENCALHCIDRASTSPYLEPSAFLSGGGGLLSTTTDYLRFAQMLLNGGELDGTRLLGRKTLEMMRTNYLPDALMPIEIGGDYIYGTGFGLGFSIVTNVPQSGVLGSEGNYGWSGAATTNFWIDPQEELLGISMTQFMPTGHYPFTRDFRLLTYQALVD